MCIPPNPLEVLEDIAARRARWALGPEIERSEDITVLFDSKYFTMEAIRTNPFREKDPQYSKHIVVPLSQPSDDTLQLTKAALWALKRIYRPGYAYAKAGVMLLDLQPNTGIQGHLFLQTADPTKRANLNETMDKINRQWGRWTLRLASAGFNHGWKMRQNSVSPCWTTR